MRLTFLGGADEVGASGTLIEIAGKRLLVDAGVRISAKLRRGVGDDQLPDLRLISEAGGPDYILVTHAHTDHTGALPLVVEQYPQVPVLATAPTIELVRVLQADAQRIMKSRQEQEGELPLFDEIAVERLMQAFQIVEPRQPLKLGESLQVTYHVSGHIVGAAMLVIESGEGTLVMSGDLSLTAQRAVVRAALPQIKADALVLESTYGGKLHANRLAEEKRLVETLRGVIARGGRALIPAFALGRAQEVLQILLANRDQIEAPVYADGMVRAVCGAYRRFADWLPPETVKAAGEDDLFFRSQIKAVQSGVQRETIGRDESPAVIVASSGMLTGGPSAVYARHLAGDPRNAILLTGYQDEESPGRFIQRIIRERQENEEVAFQIDGQTVSLRCELGTYSLSAHADEAELVSVAEALDAAEIALVHGDPAARHSLATKLRARGRMVRMPVSGQVLEFNFERKPWRIGRAQSGSRLSETAGRVDVAQLWEALKGQAGSYFSARELARMWSGDDSQAAEISAALRENGVYFAADWRQKDTFQVRTAEQVARAQRQRAIIQANPDLVGKLVVLRDSNNRPRVGVVVNAEADAFDAIALNTKGRHYPADALVWPVADWDGPREGSALVGRLSALVKEAKLAQETVLPYERRQQLVDAGQPVNPAALIPSTLPEGLSLTAALLAVAMTLAGDGAILEAEGLIPRRAFAGEPLEQNTARQLAMEAFPAEARLRKVGMEIHRKRMTLTFDFPERALDVYAELIESVGDQTGWEVMVYPQVNQQALGLAVMELLPPGGQVVKGPSFYLDRREVQVDVRGVDDLDALANAYADVTGHRLRLNADKSEASPAVIAAPGGYQQMEINAAYGLIRLALEPFGLMRTSLKQGQIVLAFISPQVGARHQEAIAALAAETGYGISVHPHPDQNAILQVVQRLVREAGWQIRKGPGLHVDRAEVAVTLATEPSAEQMAEVAEALEAETGYRLMVKT